MRQEDSIYAKLYQKSNANMRASGNAFQHSEAAFLYYAEQNDPGAVDLMKLFKTPASNPDFLEIAYLAVLNRPVDEGAVDVWKRHFSLPENEFRRQLLKTLSKSGEAVLRHKWIYNNIYNIKKASRRGTFRARLVQKLYRFYRRMPNGLKALAKRILGRV